MCGEIGKGRPAHLLQRICSAAVEEAGAENVSGSNLASIYFGSNVMPRLIQYDILFQYVHVHACMLREVPDGLQAVAGTLKRGYTRLCREGRM